MEVSEAVKVMKAEIKANGPITGSMDVYDDFFHYGDGVYKVIWSLEFFKFCDR